MPLSQSSVAAASAAWVWIPDNATVVERAGFTAFGQEPNYDVPLLSVTAGVGE